MLEKVLAGLGLLACIVIALRMGLGAARTRRIDSAAARTMNQAGQKLKALPRWRRDRQTARREADNVIERARRRQADATREGNVIRPRFGDKTDD